MERERTGRNSSMPLTDSECDDGTGRYEDEMNTQNQTEFSVAEISNGQAAFAISDNQEMENSSDIGDSGNSAGSTEAVGSDAASGDTGSGSETEGNDGGDTL